MKMKLRRKEAAPYDDKATEVMVGEILVRIGAVTEAQLANAVEQQRKDTTALGDILVRNGTCSPDDIAQALEIQLKMRSGKADPALGAAALDIMHARIQRYRDKLTKLSTLAMDASV